MSDNYNDYNNNLNENSYVNNMYDENNGFENSEFNSYVYVSENYTQPKKKKKHRVLKTIALLLCVAIVGTGAAFGYKIYKDNEKSNELSEFKADDDESESLVIDNNSDKSDNNTDSGPSLIQLASRSDAKQLPDIVDEIMPSVVGVSATFEYEYSGGLFGFGGTQTQQMQGTGTGIVMTADGYIITNAHVVYDQSTYNAGKAIEVSVLFSDTTEHEAKIIAYDPETDIAVLKVNETGLTPATFGNSDELRVGELVIAVGNPLGFDLFGSVTSGIVSALNRQIAIDGKDMNLIQTDAAINSGNSGGPLLNSCGQVIGINSAKMSSSYGSASVEGLGFAIPINEAKVIIDELINNGYVTGKPQIGIATVDVDEVTASYYNLPMGVFVSSVEPGSAAEIAGIQARDVIIDIEGEAVTTAAELNRIKNKYKAGDTIQLTVNRGGQDIKIQLVLGEDKSNSSQNSEKDR